MKISELKPFDIITIPNNEDQEDWIGVYIDESHYIGYREGIETKGTLFYDPLNRNDYEVICNLKDVMTSMMEQPPGDLQLGHGEYLFGALDDGRIRLTLSKGKDITTNELANDLVFVDYVEQFYGHEAHSPFNVIAPMGKLLAVLKYHHKYTK